MGEGLEETLQAGRRDADSRVPHGKLQAGFAVLRQGVKTDLNVAALGELDGVPGQIEQDLLQSHPVAHDRIRRLVRHTAVEAQPLLACPHGKDSRNLVQHPPQAEGGRFQFQLARLDLGGVQQVVQKRQEQVGRSLGGLQAVLDRRVDRLRQRHVDHAQDGVHRRAQFVAHVGQELALGDVGGLGGFLGVLQRFFRLDPLGDVGIRSEPPDDAPLLVANRDGAGKMRPHCPIMPAKRERVFPRLSLGDGGLPSL